uniref:Uncharacterized protein n=1 Tax=Anguilla anguilla TaxID=7936 RepID=A0A0E9T026_ANGAN
MEFEQKKRLLLRLNILVIKKQRRKK